MQHMCISLVLDLDDNWILYKHLVTFKICSQCFDESLSSALTHVIMTEL